MPTGQKILKSCPGISILPPVSISSMKTKSDTDQAINDYSDLLTDCQANRHTPSTAGLGEGADQAVILDNQELLQGSVLSPDLHPIANRDAEITIPTSNRTLFDWVSFTLKLNDPHDITRMIGLERSVFTDLPYGFSGYRKSLKFGNISIYYDGREDMGCHVEMTGQGCRLYEGQFSELPWPQLFQEVFANNAQFTRLDIAIDNVDGALTLEKIWDAIEHHDSSVRTQFGEWRRILKGSFEKEKLITGNTIYLGSSKSHIQFRIYDKAQESDITGHWIRFELQLRNKRAHMAARLFAGGESIGMLAAGIINTYFAIINDDDSNKSRCSLQSWWSEWLQSTEKIALSSEQAIKLVSDTMSFIKHQYAPSLAMIQKHLGGPSFKTFVQEVLENGIERMSEKHNKILAASKATEIIGRKK